MAGFEPTDIDDHRVILQEWIAEAIALWGIAVGLIVVTVVESGSDVTEWVYRISGGTLLALAVLTALTGARTRVIWFKICPVVLGLSAALLVGASFAE